MFKKFAAAVLIAGVSLLAVACGGGNQAPKEQPKQQTEEKAPKLDGRVIIDGSGTVFPLMAHMAEEYMTTKQPNVSVQVARAGTSAGFKKFVVGELDFVNASRPVKKEEAEQLLARGLKVGEDVLEFKIALDGLTMVINKNNDWATEMTKQEIIDMYISGTFKADDRVLWSDIRPEWPAEEIRFYGPNENHGTYEFFWEVILGKKDMVKTANLQQEYSTLVDLVANDRNAIAFFGFGYYVTNQDKIRAIKIDFGNGSVEPTIATIGEDLPYAGFTRPVFTYLDAQQAKAKPQVLNFAKFIVSEGAARLAGANGFAPLPQAQYDAYLEQLKNLK